MCKGGITRLKLHLAHILKCNVKKCEKVPADVKAEMIELLAKKNIIKENKTKERKRARDEVNLDHDDDHDVDVHRQSASDPSSQSDSEKSISD